MADPTRVSGVVPKTSIFLFALGATATDLNLPHVGGFKAGVLILMTCLTLAIFLYLKVNHFRIPKPALGPSSGIYLVYLALVLVSALWSPSTVNTLTQFVILCSVWLCAVLLSAAPPQLMVRYLVYLTIVTAALSLAVIPLSTTYSFQPVTSSDRPELRGVFYHQLRLGQYAAVGLALMLLVWINRDQKKVFLKPVLIALSAPIVLVVTYLAYARLYTFFTAVACALVLAYSRGKWLRILATVGLVIVVTLLISFEAALEAGLSDAGVDTTLTGRVRLWTVTLEAAANKPWLGHGYGAFDQPMYDAMWRGIYRPAHPHNSYIQALFENGYFGITLVIALSLVHLAVSAKPDRAEGRYSYSLLFIALLILGSLTGANYASSVTSLFCLSLWFITAKETRARRHILTTGDRA